MAKDKDPDKKPEKNAGKRGMVYKKTPPIVQSQTRVKCTNCGNFFMPRLDDVNTPINHKNNGVPCNY